MRTRPRDHALLFPRFCFAGAPVRACCSGRRHWYRREIETVHGINDPVLAPSQFGSQHDFVTGKVRQPADFRIVSTSLLASFVWIQVQLLLACFVRVRKQHRAGVAEFLLDLSQDQAVVVIVVFVVVWCRMQMLRKRGLFLLSHGRRARTSSVVVAGYKICGARVRGCIVEPSSMMVRPCLKSLVFCLLLVLLLFCLLLILLLHNHCRLSLLRNEQTTRLPRHRKRSVATTTTTIAGLRIRCCLPNWNWNRNRNRNPPAEK
mmetsp:Transcript_6981/g.13777  ORF Transcript_6981/g.13777 Transcript_6981/m.13777 type:complete len:261 (-) Transcript_6981:3-785(-)